LNDTTSTRHLTYLPAASPEFIMPEETRNKYKKIFPFYIITGSLQILEVKYPNILEQKDFTWI
jgi:hypothetical protein